MQPHQDQDTILLWVGLALGIMWYTPDILLSLWHLTR